MIQHPRVAIAVVGVGAILPDAPTAAQFWENVRNGRYSISDVDPARWDPDLYYDPDPHAVDRTYSRIGGWVRDFEWNPLGWRLPVPPRVGEQMDDGQKWAINCARAALVDYGWPERPIDTDRTAVILGNALAGEKHYRTHLRVSFPEFARELERAPHFAALPAEVRAAIESEARDALWQDYQGITEDTMPGELANVIAGRVANLFDLHGPNYVCDAACASAMAAMNAGISGLVDGDFDAVLTGGIDRNMNAAAYVKFCKIGALSATGTRPYGEGADGFVMGEGAALFLLRRLADAERDGDRIYAVIRGMAGSSDGRGKGITAPNPVGQRLAMERAWSIAGLSPATATLVEGHGTSTRVGDVVEVESLARVFGDAGAAPGSIALGSVKSNIGHLKGAAGAAGMLKTVLALHDRVLPPSLHAVTPNPDVDFEQTPFTVNHELCEWRTPGGDGVRRAGVSAFGFGGTNFHAVLEEHVPGRLNGGATRSFAVGAGVSQSAPAPATPAAAPPAAPAPRSPLRGALLVGAHDIVSLAARLAAVEREARAGTAPPPAPPAAADLRAPERVAIDYGDAAELAERAAAVQRALALEASGTAAPMWKALRARGVFRGQGPAARVAFLYPGQGSQYANMLATLRAADPIVAETFDEADQIMIPLLGRPLSDVIFVDPGDGDALARAEQALRETEITQPAVMAVDLALTRLLAAYGIAPDMAMGHSLGEYAALMTAGSLTFEHTMEAVSARGREMSSLTLEDRGLMAAVFAPLGEVEAAVAGVDGCVVANVNSNSQAVIGGATAAVTAVMETLSAAGHTVVPLPVSHAFHTSIVAPASVPLRAALTRLGLRPPQMPVVANVTGELYPTGDGAAGATLDLLAGQVASPVQFVAGLRTLYREGARVFVEVGPKRALAGFADDVLGADPEVVSLITNHPKVGDIVSFNQALCGLWAAGLGIGVEDAAPAITTQPPPVAAADEREPEATMPQDPTPQDHLRPGGDRVDQPVAGARKQGPASAPAPAALEPVVITGASLGLPGRERIFDDGNVAAALRGEQGIDVVPTRFRQAMLDKHITRLVKRERGDPTFEVIDDPGEVIKLAARGGALDVVEEFGISAERRAALDRTTELAIGAGIDALRDAGIPLVLRYRTTTTGTLLPDRHLLPESMRDDTGIVFASAFPGGDALIGALNAYHEDRARREQLEQLRSLRPRMEEGGADAVALTELDRRIRDLERAIEADPYRFDRRFLFRVLSMGHSQLAELIGARGPNTQVNSACASTTQAIAVAEDWIRAGRCRRVIVVAADDVTSDNMLEWVGAGFLASGAAATDDVVAEAALPFDRRRHGMLLGMGAAALVVESAEAARERAITPICEVLGVITANSAFHGTRLDVAHISRLMETLVAGVERRAGLDRMEMASELVFVSHETYTPARGGSAAAEVEALRAVFGDAAGSIVVANTKGFTGHAMGVGIEDVAAVKALETGIVPPVPNFREVDPELGELRLSRGGAYPVRYALRLAAGFGSQISMSVLRWVPAADGVRRAPDQLGYAYRIADRLAWTGWLNRIGGRPDTELEVVKRTLRVHDEAPAHPVRTPEPQRVEPRSAAAPVAPGNRHAPAAPAPAPAAETATAVAMPESPTPAATAVAAPPVVEEAAIRERVLALVAEKTGYPQDMLDLDLDLEADLGVDTVKQAELFAVIREHYGIPRDDSLRLRDVPTLAHIIRFVVDRIPGGDGGGGGGGRGGGAPAPASAPAETPVEASPLRAGALDFGAADSVPRRVPVAIPRPALELCAATGVSLGAGSRVIVAGDEGGVAAALAGRLRALGALPLFVDTAADAAALTAAVEALAAEGPVQGVHWLPGLDVEPPLAGLDLAGWREGLRRRVKLLHATMRAVGGIEAAGTFLVSATRLGGRHGYDDAGATAPMGGAVTGFTKAFARERPAVLVKAVDHDSGADPDTVAEHLVAETLRDPGAVEVGHALGARWTVGLEERPAADGGAGMRLGPGSVVVVTGAAGGIVSAIVADLAAATGATFHLLDLTPAPARDDPDPPRVATDREGLKRDLVARMREGGERVTPVMVDRRLAALERQAAALDAVTAVEAAGGEAHYHAVDLTDTAAVARVVDAVRTRHGRIDVLLHAAGLEVSRLLPDKAPAEFDLVFDVKSDGLHTLLGAAGDMPLGAVVVFSSVAGRFGNGGQTDYSAANDLLCKVMSSMRTTRPATRAIAVDWTAWGGIGMATRGSVPKMMELAGIDMLPPQAGIPTVRRELLAGATRGEIVVGGRLGILVEERAPRGGAGDHPFTGAGPMVERLAACGVWGPLVTDVTLDPARHRFLDDHRIEGTPVLPGVMSIEAFVETSRLALPGWHVVAVEDVDFSAPFKIYRDQPRTATVEVRFARGASDVEEIVARCTLLGSRTLAGHDQPQTTVHARGRVRLRRTPLEPGAATPCGEAPATAVGAADLYRVYFHGPGYRVLDAAWREGDAVVGRLATGLPDAAVGTLHAPLLAELCFQAAGVRELGSDGVLALPAHVDAVSVVLPTGAPTAPVHAVTRRRDGGVDAEVVDARGTVLLRMRGYRTTPLPLPLGDDLLAPFRRAMA